jgi:cytoskeletal protein RodZ
MSMAGPRRRSHSRLWSVSGIVGAILLAIGLLWLLMLLWQAYAGPKFSLAHLSAGSTSGTSTVQIPALYTAGIILGTPAQPARLDQQQAILLASQWEPGAASKAKKIQARYVLLTYIPHNASKPQIENQPAWMVLYEEIPLQPADASVDPTPFPSSYYDLYVFLDANSGKPLLSVWT